MIHLPCNCHSTETCGNSPEKPLGFLAYYHFVTSVTPNTNTYFIGTSSHSKRAASRQSNFDLFGVWLDMVERSEGGVIYLQN